MYIDSPKDTTIPLEEFCPSIPYYPLDSSDDIFKGEDFQDRAAQAARANKRRLKAYRSLCMGDSSQGPKSESISMILDISLPKGNGDYLPKCEEEKCRSFKGVMSKAKRIRLVQSYYKENCSLSNPAPYCNELEKQLASKYCRWFCEKSMGKIVYGVKMEGKAECEHEDSVYRQLQKERIDHEISVDLAPLDDYGVRESGTPIKCTEFISTDFLRKCGDIKRERTVYLNSDGVPNLLKLHADFEYVCLANLKKGARHYQDMKDRLTSRSKQDDRLNSQLKLATKIVENTDSFPQGMSLSLIERESNHYSSNRPKTSLGPACQVWYEKILGVTLTDKKSFSPQDVEKIIGGKVSSDSSLSEETVDNFSKDISDVVEKEFIQELGKHSLKEKLFAYTMSDLEGLTNLEGNFTPRMNRACKDHGIIPEVQGEIARLREEADKNKEGIRKARSQLRDTIKKRAQDYRTVDELNDRAVWLYAGVGCHQQKPGENTTLKNICEKGIQSSKTQAEKVEICDNRLDFLLELDAKYNGEVQLDLQNQDMCKVLERYAQNMQDQKSEILYAPPIPRFLSMPITKKNKIYNPNELAGVQYIEKGGQVGAFDSKGLEIDIEYRDAARGFQSLRDSARGLGNKVIREAIDIFDTSENAQLYADALVNPETSYLRRPKLALDAIFEAGDDRQIDKLLDGWTGDHQKILEDDIIKGCQNLDKEGRKSLQVPEVVKSFLNTEGNKGFAWAACRSFLKEQVNEQYSELRDTYKMMGMYSLAGLGILSGAGVLGPILGPVVGATETVVSIGSSFYDYEDAREKASEAQVRCQTGQGNCDDVEDKLLPAISNNHLSLLALAAFEGIIEVGNIADSIKGLPTKARRGDGARTSGERKPMTPIKIDELNSSDIDAIDKLDLGIVHSKLTPEGQEKFIETMRSHLSEQGFKTENLRTEDILNLHAIERYTKKLSAVERKSILDELKRKLLKQTNPELCSIR